MNQIKTLPTRIGSTGSPPLTIAKKSNPEPVEWMSPDVERSLRY
jgi:hypothetical protein